MKELAERLARAERPVMILGGTRWTEAAVRQVERFAERAEIPVGCSFRRQMLFDHTHPCYAGDVGIGINPALAAAIKGSDLVMLVGGRFSEMPSSGYTCSISPARNSRWSTSMPMPASSAGSTPDAGDQCRSGILRRSTVGS